MTTQQTQSYQIHIDDMTCSSCVASVEKAILSVDNVTQGTVNLIEKTALVNGGHPQEVVDAIIDQGYKARFLEKRITSNHYQLKITADDQQQAAEILSHSPDIHKLEFIAADPYLMVQLTNQYL